MRTLPVLFLAIIQILAISLCDGASHHPFGREKVSNLHFYLHDTLSGKDPTAVLVARNANITAGAMPFSAVYVVDDVLTEGPQRQSKVIGNAQGMYISSGKSAFSLVLGIDFEITHGRFNGSSFVVYSRNPVADGDGREVAIVGGRGAFRMARGFALLRTHYLDSGNGDGIIEYNVTLLHY